MGGCSRAPMSLNQNEIINSSWARSAESTSATVKSSQLQSDNAKSSSSQSERFAAEGIEKDRGCTKSAQEHCTEMERARRHSYECSYYVSNKHLSIQNGAL